MSLRYQSGTVLVASASAYSDRVEWLRRSEGCVVVSAGAMHV
jgi:hypothetical protein